MIWILLMACNGGSIDGHACGDPAERVDVALPTAAPSTRHTGQTRWADDQTSLVADVVLAIPTDIGQVHRIVFDEVYGPSCGDGVRGQLTFTGGVVDDSGLRLTPMGNTLELALAGPGTWDVSLAANVQFDTVGEGCETDIVAGDAIETTLALTLTVEPPPVALRVDLPCPIWDMPPILHDGAAFELEVVGNAPSYSLVGTDGVLLASCNDPERFTVHGAGTIELRVEDELVETWDVRSTDDISRIDAIIRSAWGAEIPSGSAPSISGIGHLTLEPQVFLSDGWSSCGTEPSTSFRVAVDGPACVAVAAPDLIGTELLPMRIEPTGVAGSCSMEMTSERFEGLSWQGAISIR
jgi:hypothetical protein